MTHPAAALLSWVHSLPSSQHREGFGIRDGDWTLGSGAGAARNGPSDRAGRISGPRTWNRTQDGTDDYRGLTTRETA